MNRRNFILSGLLAPVGAVIGSRFDLKSTTPRPRRQGLGAAETITRSPTPLTFENFVVGEENQMAFFMAQRTAMRLDGIFPLFVRGPSGVGKTHLVQAMRNEIKLYGPDLRIYSNSSERFINDVVQGIRTQSLKSFREKLKYETDVLILEDVHVLARTCVSQEEFLHIFEELKTQEKQMIFTSDRMPCDMVDLDEKIRSRLSVSETVSVGLPGLQSRRHILSQFIRANGYKIPDDVVTFVASRDRTSVRQMQGDLATLRMCSELKNVPISLSLAKEVLS